MASRSFDKQGLYTVEQVSPSEKTVDWISIVTLLRMSLGRRWNPFEDAQCKQLLTILLVGCLWQECCCAMVWRHFLKLNLLHSHPRPFQLTTSQKACGGPQHCSMASKKNCPICHYNPSCGHVVIGFWYSSCRVEAPTTVTWSSDASLEAHRRF